MHFYFGLRGIKNKLDFALMMMQCQMWPWHRNNLNICECNKDLLNFSLHKKHEGKCKEKGCECMEFKPRAELCQVQGALRPCFGFYEYVFPEENLNEVLTIFHVKDGSPLGLKGAIIRKALGKGIKKIPDFEPVPTNKFIDMIGVAIYPIGIKKDRREKCEWAGYEQEML